MILLLFIAISTWILVPILGIFPLLLWLQLRHLKRAKTIHKNNNLVENIFILCIIITISIFASSTTVYSDTAVYIDSYEKMNWNDIFNQSQSNSDIYGYGLEMVLFILCYPIKILSNSSPYYFLLFFSLFVNIATVYIAKSVSKKYYFLLLIIIFSTVVYYNHVFLMRQFLSNVFLLIAAINIDFLTFWLLLPLSLFSHLSTLPYLILLILIKIIVFYNLLHKKANSNADVVLPRIKQIYPNIKKNSLFAINKSSRAKLLIVLLMVILSALFSTSSNSSNSILSSLLPDIQAAQTISQRSEHYLGSDSDTTSLGNIFFVTATFLTIGILLRKLSFETTSPTTFFLIVVLAIQIAISCFMPNIIRMRLALLLLSYQGLFYSVLADSKNKLLERLTWIYPLFSIASMIRYFIIMPSYPEYSGILVFFKGEVLSKNLIDYLDFFVNARVIID